MEQLLSNSQLQDILGMISSNDDNTVELGFIFLKQSKLSNCELLKQIHDKYREYYTNKEFCKSIRQWKEYNNLMKTIEQNLKWLKHELIKLTINKIKACKNNPKINKKLSYYENFLKRLKTEFQKIAPDEYTDNVFKY